MIMNTHALPSRMTVAQLLEMLLGKAAPELGVVGNATLFMNEGNPAIEIGKVLEEQLGMQALGDDLLYDGMSGNMIPAQFFVGNCYTMRLKHMPEDKWNARAEGRREQRTRQPTGGRGAQGGLRIGEMEREAILGHGIVDFTQETYMKRSDGYETYVCNGCGTVPIYNEGEKLFVCSMCDGPVKYTGTDATDLDILPPNKRSTATFSKIQIPYSMNLLNQELNTYMNIGMRVLTSKDVKKFKVPNFKEITADQARALTEAPLPQRQLQETEMPEFLPPPAEEPAVQPDDLAALGVGAALEEEEAAAAVVAAAPAVPVAQPQVVGPANGLPTVVLQPAIPAPEAGLQEEDLDAIPYAEGAAAASGFASAPVAAAAPAAAAAPSVNVQAAAQPILVMPVNVAQPAPPAEIYSTGIPGAPATIAVDTSASAMRTVGLPAAPQPQAGGSRTRARSRSNSGGSSGSAPSLQINKLGGSGLPAAASSPNVKLTVNKLA
jgi:hypothetical protein